MVGGGSFCGDLGWFALVMDFNGLMLTSLPELAYCGGKGDFLLRPLTWICNFMREFLVK